METYGELKQAIKAISLKQKGAKVGNLALDVVLGSIPGIGTAKTTFDFVKAAFAKPDTKKSNSWLDKLDIDDNMSSIIDDTVENGFLQMISKAIDSESDATPLESDFNMNAKMVDYLKQQYGGRHVAGITENKIKLNTILMKKSEITQIIKEEISKLKNLSELEPAAPQTIQGNIKLDLFKKLGVANFEPAKFSAAVNLVKQGKPLNVINNKVLADVMVAMIKSSDDGLLTQIFQNLKQIEAK
jgi:hypothetical protein